ncbi:hypothetical protein ACFO5O_08135 [Geojedonia litorea]|uniref:AZL_007920/MXAN_0976 family protein n=1 Tax=Geojedonia litorea TaxID=1268269 RepID=A0ABV9N1Y5_9FLAO
MKKLIYTIFGVVLMLSQYSCTDQSTFNNPAHHELENGAFVRFTNNGVAATYPDAQNISISEEIYDANGNISEYSLTLTATISGATYKAEDFIIITSFPAVLNITSQSMADALGVSVSNLGFGDSFNFIGKATRNDGVVFYGVRPSFSSTQLTVGLGNTEGQLFTPAYKNAMNFGTIVSCPFVQADMLGTYTIIEDDGFNATTDTQFEVIAGANANQIILVNPLHSAGNFNIAVNVSALGIATFPRQDAVLTEEICCAGYSPTWFRSNATVSLGLSCIGYLSLNFDTGLGFAGSDGTGFTFGPGVFIAQKN